MTSEFLANFRSEKHLTLPLGAKGKWIDSEANERLDTYYNNGKCPQIILQKFTTRLKETDSKVVNLHTTFRKNMSCIQC